MRQKKKEPKVKRHKKAVAPEDRAHEERQAAERARDAMVEREFKLGQLSMEEISRRSGGYAPAPRLTRQGIKKRADKGGWERSLLPAVQAKVKERLVRDAAPGNATPSEAVDAAAERAVGIVVEHRASLGRLKRITDLLTATVQGYLEGEIEVIPWLRAGDTLPGVVARLAQAQAKVCALERQAFNVDAEPEKPPAEPVRFYMNLGAPQEPPAERQGPADTGGAPGGAPVGA